MHIYDQPTDDRPTSQFGKFQNGYNSAKGHGHPINVMYV